MLVCIIFSILSLWVTNTKHTRSKLCAKSKVVLFLPLSRIANSCTQYSFHVRMVHFGNQSSYFDIVVRILRFRVNTLIDHSAGTGDHWWVRYYQLPLGGNCGHKCHTYIWTNNTRLHGHFILFLSIPITYRSPLLSLALCVCVLYVCQAPLHSQTEVNSLWHCVCCMFIRPLYTLRLEWTLSGTVSVCCVSDEWCWILYHDYSLG